MEQRQDILQEQMKQDRAKFRKQMKSKKKKSGANSNGFVVEIRSPKNQVTSKKVMYSRLILINLKVTHTHMIFIASSLFAVNCVVIS